jgi:hypothetical protein
LEPLLFCCPCTQLLNEGTCQGPFCVCSFPVHTLNPGVSSTPGF